MAYGEGSGPRLGVAYYPEQWPRERWRVDAELMAGAGLSLVRLGEFAWAQLEPEENRFDFDWLDDAIAVLAEAGLEIVLGTPTAAPPVWLIERHPGVLPVEGDGTVHPFGHRRHYCPSSGALHEATERIVRALASRYGGDPRVVAWQVDNEFGGRCFCDRCRLAFQDWLQSRYGTVEALNDSWGTAFWSQTYAAWDQIPLPEAGPVPLPSGFLRRSPNPGLALDFRRFSSESYVAFQRLQVELLRKACHPGQKITHNLMGFRFPEIDYHQLAADLDFVSWDNYPLLGEDGRWSTPALSADAMRGLKGTPVWVLEQQVGPLGWGVLRTPRRGQMRLFTYQAIAHGAEAVVYFRWRTPRFGTEQYWHGFLDHDGEPRRRYEELDALAGELERLRAPLTGLHPRADVALLHDYDARFALQIQPTNPALGYEETIQRHYEALRQLGLGVDVVSPAAELGRYRLVVAANLFVIDPATAATLAAYVAEGGVLIIAPRTAVKDRCNSLPERPLPAWLDELAGIEVVDYVSGPDEATVRFATDGPALAGEFGGWYEELELKGARCAASYLDGEFAGTTAIATNEVGAGQVTYLAGAAGVSTLRSLYRRVCDAAGLALADVPEDIEIVRIGNGAGEEFLFALNHAPAERSLDLGNGAWHDLLTDRSGAGPVELGPHGVALLAARVPSVVAGASEEGDDRAHR
jgi:beta-galactosidase